MGVGAGRRGDRGPDHTDGDKLEWLGSKGSCRADQAAVLEGSWGTVLLKNPIKFMLQRDGPFGRSPPYEVQKDGERQMSSDGTQMWNLLSHPKERAFETDAKISKSN